MRARLEQRAGKTQPSAADADRRAVECGLDVAMLRDNLALPVTERLRRHDLALSTVEMLRKARRL